MGLFSSKPKSEREIAEAELAKSGIPAAKNPGRYTHYLKEDAEGRTLLGLARVVSPSDDETWRNAFGPK